MLIRRATPDDIPFIRDLAHRVWWAHYPEIITDEQIEYMLGEWYAEPALRSQMLEQGHEFWMVYDGETPNGYIALSRKEGEGQYYLHKFYLDGRGKGLGSAAFRAVMEQYPDLRQLRLNVNRRNYKSVNFYFKVGFRIEYWMDLPVGPGYVMDDFVMLWERKTD